MQKCGRQKLLIEFFLHSETQRDGKFWSSIFLFHQQLRLNAQMQTRWFIYTLKTQDEQIECRPHTQFRATAKFFKSTLYLLSCPTEKLPFGSFLCAQNHLSFRVLDGSPGCLHQATTVQHFTFHSPEPSAVLMLWETAEETWWQTLIVAVKCCGRFIMTGKSVLYFKSKKSDQLAGGFEFHLNRFWLKIKVIVCIIMVAWNC